MESTTLLNDLLSRDATKIWSAAGAILNSWDRPMLLELAQQLPEIREKTKGIDLGGLLHPNVVHLANALRRIEYVRDSEACLCKLYGATQFDNPQQESERGHVKILETKFADGYYVDFYTCECQHCHARYKVSEREYHYTFWTWSVLDQVS